MRGKPMVRVYAPDGQEIVHPTDQPYAHACLGRRDADGVWFVYRWCLTEPEMFKAARDYLDAHPGTRLKLVPVTRGYRNYDGRFKANPVKCPICGETGCQPFCPNAPEAP